MSKASADEEFLKQSLYIAHLMQQDPEIITVGNLNATVTSLSSAFPARLQSVMSALERIEVDKATCFQKKE